MQVIACLEHFTLPHVRTIFMKADKKVKLDKYKCQTWALEFNCRRWLKMNYKVIKIMRCKLSNNNRGLQSILKFGKAKDCSI